MNHVIKKLKPFPLLGEKCKYELYFEIDLSHKNPNLARIKNQDDLTLYIESQIVETSNTLPYGGYGEKRSIYQSSLFQKETENRNIHLAIDVWVNSKTKIYAPLDGRVFSLAYNNNGLDYGNTLILEHTQGSIKFYSLYGHLGPSIFNLWETGSSVRKGDYLGNVGNITENGGWCPHVHCQLIKDLQGNIGDYPGVCSEDKKDFYLSNCPNPIALILPKKY